MESCAQEELREDSPILLWLVEHDSSCEQEQLTDGRQPCRPKIRRERAVTTQGSSDGIREKAMRIASIDELETGNSTAVWSSPGGAENDRTGKTNELVRSLAGIIKKETFSSFLAASQN